MSGKDEILLRPALPEDAGQIAAIYGEYVLHGLATFEETPPDAEEMARRMAQVKAQSYPWLVAGRAGRIVGYAYLSRFKERSAYRFTAEDSVYVAPACRGQGIGSRLLAALLEQASKSELHSIMAVIGDSDNRGSVALHARHGFRHVGVARALGFKLGRWVDVVYMQKMLANRPGRQEKP